MNEETFTVTELEEIQAIEACLRRCYEVRAFGPVKIRNNGEGFDVYWKKAPGDEEWEWRGFGPSAIELRAAVCTFIGARERLESQP